MTPVRALLGAVALATALVVSAGPAAAEQPGVRTGWQERMLARVNAVRAEAGARPLRLCPTLTRSAEAYAREMARDNWFGHTGADGSTTGQRIAAAGYRPVLVGENLAAGQPTVAEAMGDWRRSSTHYATMTDPHFRHVGFGYQRGGASRTRPSGCSTSGPAAPAADGQSVPTPSPRGRASAASVVLGGGLAGAAAIACGAARAGARRRGAPARPEGALRRVLLELGAGVGDVEVAHGQLADAVGRAERGVARRAPSTASPGGSDRCGPVVSRIV